MTKKEMMDTIIKARGHESIWTRRFCILCEQNLVGEQMLEKFYLPHMLQAKEIEG